MQSSRAKVMLAVVSAAVVVGLFFVLQGGSSTDSRDSVTTAASTDSKGQSKTKPKPKIPVIVVRGGKPVGGVRKLDYTNGQRIRFVVKSDVADEVHVHGYDIAKPVSAGGSVRFDFPADIEGVFEAELENRAVKLIEFAVNP